jgi:hypothetical protein
LRASKLANHVWSRGLPPLREKGEPMFRFLNLLALVGSILLAGLALADEGEKKGKGGFRFDPERIFKAMDANSDGKVTLEEFKKHWEEREKQIKEFAEKFKEKFKDKLKDKGKANLGTPEDRFKRLDANKDGVVTLDEFKKAFEGRPQPAKDAPKEKKDKKKEE